jgi:membrane-associated protease RseP (regulator of RpoE activity)
VPDDLDQLFRDFRRGLPEMPAVPRFDPFDADVEKWMEEQRKYMEDLRRRFRGPAAPVPPPPAAPPAPVPSGPEFGVKVDPVEETLRDQLSLKAGEGVMVGEVKPGSLADKAGLKKHDIILKLDGSPVGDTWGFRKDVLKALERPEFELGILRGGKPETLKVKPGARKDE